MRIVFLLLLSCIFYSYINDKRISKIDEKSLEDTLKKLNFTESKNALIGLEHDILSLKGYEIDTSEPTYWRAISPSGFFSFEGYPRAKNLSIGDSYTINIRSTIHACVFESFEDYEDKLTEIYFQYKIYEFDEKLNEIVLRTWSEYSQDGIIKESFEYGSWGVCFKNIENVDYVHILTDNSFYINSENGHLDYGFIYENQLIKFKGDSIWKCSYDLRADTCTCFNPH